MGLDKLFSCFVPIVNFFKDHPVRPVMIEVQEVEEKQFIVLRHQPPIDYSLPNFARSCDQNVLIPMGMRIHCQVLGVTEGSISIQQLGRLYRRLVINHHPDKNRHNPAAEEKCKQINNAYSQLLGWLQGDRSAIEELKREEAREEKRIFYRQAHRQLDQVEERLNSEVFTALDQRMQRLEQLIRAQLPQRSSRRHKPSARIQQPITQPGLFGSINSQTVETRYLTASAYAGQISSSRKIARISL